MLMDERAKILSDLETAKAGTRDQATHISALIQKNNQLERKEQLKHLIERVSVEARKQILDGGPLRDRFQSTEPCSAFVLSIDIRRSTELMLKAREPAMFADFVTGLCDNLRRIILKTLGVFDKFTGDGVLAFFPEFYSGADAGFRAVQAASECHLAFQQHYAASRKCFTSVLKDTGLGIGIDFGRVQIVRLGGELTVVGNPVVYACRLGGAPIGCTYLNQPAYEQLFDKHSAYCDFTETEVVFKHEGAMIAYSIKLNGKMFKVSDPEWLLSNRNVSKAVASGPSTDKRAAKK